MPTEVVSTIRSSGGDYTTLTAWESAVQGNLVAADEIRTAECYNDWPSGLNDQLTISGSTTSSTCYLKITVAPGHRHDGTFGSGFRIARSTFLYVISSLDSYSRIEWLEIEQLYPGFCYGMEFSSSALGIKIDNCLIRGPANGVGVRLGDVVITRTLVHSFTTAFITHGTTSFYYAYNCVASASTNGFSGHTGGVRATLKNCVAFGCTTDYANGPGVYSASCTNNATSAATTTNVPGANPVANIGTGDFVDSANYDYHLSAASALRGSGVNLYSDFTTDIDGDTWPSAGSWDIGFDYYASAAAASLSPLRSSRRFAHMMVR